MNKAQFFDYLRTSYNQARGAKVELTKQIAIGEFEVKLNFLEDTLMPVFYKAFQHLESANAHVDGLNIYFWTDNNEQLMPDRVPWDLNDRHHLGLIETYTDERYFTLHQPGSNAIYMYDAQSKSAYYWISEVADVPYWESDFPLRMIFHWWLKDTAYQPVHAAAVGTEKGGVLLVGKGGSGKSTSALKCVNSTLKIAGDDYVLLDCEKHQVYSLFSLTKADRRSLDLLPLMKLDPAHLLEPKDGKYRIMLFPEYQSSLIRQMPVKATLMPRITGDKKTTIVPCQEGDAMMALAPTTLFQLPGLRKEAFAKMSGFVRSSRSYFLNIGEDSDKLPEILEEFINQSLNS